MTAIAETEREVVNSSKKRLVAVTSIFLGVSLLIFVATGYTALYWAWTQGNLERARHFLPLARNFGMLAMAGAVVAFGILFSSNTFPIPAKTRLSLSLLATLAIAFFAEFRNEGKFYFKGLHHIFGPGTWVHNGLNQVVPALGDFLYRIEYSHENDFLLGPAVVSVLFPVAFARIYKALSDQDSKLGWTNQDSSAGLEQALRFARIMMNVGLFWFFWQAWAEKAGYLSNPHSSDEIDMPFEFAGTMLGFWMARILTKPFEGQQPEKFRSTLLIDFVSSGVIGLLYTLIVGPLIEGVASAVGHSLYPVVPHSLDIPEFTPLQRHMRPIELLLIAAATWWSLNRSSAQEGMTRLGGTYEEPEADAKWNAPKTVIVAFGAVSGYLAILAIMFSLLEPQGLTWTLVTAGMGLTGGTAAFLLVQWAGRHGVTRLLGSGRR